MKGPLAAVHNFCAQGCGQWAILLAVLWMKL